MLFPAWSGVFGTRQGIASPGLLGQSPRIRSGPRGGPLELRHLAARIRPSGAAKNRQGTFVETARQRPGKRTGALQLGNAGDGRKEHRRSGTLVQEGGALEGRLQKCPVQFGAVIGRRSATLAGRTFPQSARQVSS